MTHEEKLEEAKKLYKNANADQRYVLERIFPEEFITELTESDDEKIREALIDYFDDANKADENPLQSYGVQTDKAITWLKKQKSTVDINDVCEWLQKYAKCYVNGEYNYYHHYVEYDGTIDVDSMIERLKYNFG